MKRTHRWLSVAAVAAAFLAASTASHAQAPDTATAPPPHPGPVFFERVGPGPGAFFGPMDFIGFEGPVARKTVTGAPFTAAFSSQSTQTLPDGNRIQHNSTGNISRDSQGRTRHDVTLPAIGGLAASGQTAPHAVIINDPVAGAHFILHPDEKTAESMSFKGHHRYGPNAANGPDSDWAQRRAKETTTTSLGTQMIAGVSAEGTRYTRTIPAGEIGNEKPIQIVTDRWYSSELQMNVMVKRADPLQGDSVFQLTEIQRQEPAAALFQVPSDYTVTAPSGGRNRVPPPPPAE
jgi:hypothetical protein